MLSVSLLAALSSRNMEFSVMSFNIWIGGTQFQPLSQTAEVIKRAKSDIVGIQEPAESLPKLAEMLGWNRSAKASILTRFRIEEDWSVNGTRWGGAKIVLPNGQRILAYNTHLNPYPYGPYEVRDKKATNAVEVRRYEDESKRTLQMESVLKDIAARPENTLPVVFTGDFNTPSHLDWTPATQSRNFGMVVQWPVTRAVERAGFKDAFRVVHPDPLSKPGFTWSPGYPVGKLEANDVMDRIDFVVYRGGLKPISARVIGESGPVTDLAVDPWPSDHRAVDAKFLLTK